MEFDDAHASPSDPNRLRAMWLALLIAAAFLLPRGALIVNATSETLDAPYHLTHGLVALSDWLDKHPMRPRDPGYDRSNEMVFNDPPLGAMLLALPLKATGAKIEGPAKAGLIKPRGWAKTAVLYGQPLDSETLRQLVAAWKVFLFLPGLAVAFLWVRDLFGPRAGWLLLLALLLEPNLAAHLPLATVDTIGLAAIMVGAYAVWCYANRPTVRRLLLASLLVAVALLCKHTAVWLPFYAVIVCLVQWTLRDRPWGSLRTAARAGLRYGGRIAAAGLLTAAMIWPLVLFDVSAPERTVGPIDKPRPGKPIVYASADWQTWQLPAGVYLGSLITGHRHAVNGHGAYLFGMRSWHGWWYYFPVVAAYKVPLGYLALIALGVASLFWVRFRGVGEAALLLAFVLWGVSNLLQPVNIGFRHALPAYVFLLMWCCRVAATRGDALPKLRGLRALWQPGRRLATVAFALVVVGGLHALTWHPHYLPYLNFPRERAWLDISDSNIEWGQTVKPIGKWLDEHPTDRPIWALTFSVPGALAERRYFGDRVRRPRQEGKLPRHGLLILTPVMATGGSNKERDYWKRFDDVKPIAIIADSVPVYDLDAYHAAHPED